MLFGLMWWKYLFQISKFNIKIYSSLTFTILPHPCEFRLELFMHPTTTPRKSRYPQLMLEPLICCFITPPNYTGKTGYSEVPTDATRSCELQDPPTPLFYWPPDALGLLSNSPSPHFGAARAGRATRQESTRSATS